MVWFFALALGVHLVYWFLIAAGALRVQRRDPAEHEPTVPVSVVVAARDEEANLPALLEALAGQTHAHFEAIIVDDASADATAAIVSARAEADPRFRLIRVQDSRDPRKKHALAAGIAAASHDRLAFTDADCIPARRWLESIAVCAEESPEAVLVGYGPYRKEDGALNAFIRYETWITAILTAAAIGVGRPFMAVGRNFSYPRSLFDRVGGFEHQMHSLSGDDDLLVQEARRHGAPVHYVLAEEAEVYTDAPSSPGSWVRQKLRHTSAGRHYDRGVQVHLGLFHVSNLLVWISPAFLGWTGAAFIAGRFLMQRAILKRAESEFKPEPDLMVYQPLLDLAYLLYNTLLAPAGALFGGKKW